MPKTARNNAYQTRNNIFSKSVKNRHFYDKATTLKLIFLFFFYCVKIKLNTETVHQRLIHKIFNNAWINNKKMKTIAPSTVFLASIQNQVQIQILPPSHLPCKFWWSYQLHTWSDGSCSGQKPSQISQPRYQVSQAASLPEAAESCTQSSSPRST